MRQAEIKPAGGVQTDGWGLTPVGHLRTGMTSVAALGFECDRGRSGDCFISAVATARVESRIREIRGLRVILDADLADVYEVQTKHSINSLRETA